MKKLFLCMLLLLLIMPSLIQAQGQEGVALWTFETGGEIWSSPTLVDDVIYFGSDDGNFYALNASSGEEIWRFAAGDIIRSKAYVADGVLFFAADNGYLFKLDAHSGEEIWRADIGVEIANNLRTNNVGREDYDYLYSSPTVSEGVVYIGNWEMFAIDAETGEIVWQIRGCGAIPLIRSSPVVVDDRLYFGSECGDIWSVNKDTGEVIWRSPTGRANARTTPLIVDGVVYIGSRNTYIAALDAEDGSEIWRFSYGTSWVESSARAVDGVLYIGSSDLRRVVALNAETGEEIWEFNNNGYAWSSPVIENGIVYIGNLSQTEDSAHFYALNAETGEEVWHFNTGTDIDDPLAAGAGVATSPVVRDGIAFFGSRDGTFYAVGMNN